MHRGTSGTFAREIMAPTAKTRWRPRDEALTRHRDATRCCWDQYRFSVAGGCGDRRVTVPAEKRQSDRVAVVKTGRGFLPLPRRPPHQLSARQVGRAVAQQPADALRDSASPGLLEGPLVLPQTVAPDINKPAPSQRSRRTDTLAGGSLHWFEQIDFVDEAAIVSFARRRSAANF